MSHETLTLGGWTFWNTDIDAAKKQANPHSVLLLYKDKNGSTHQQVAHWAYGGGEDQPAFGPDWFYWNGYSYCSLNCKEILGWMKLPPNLTKD